MGVNMNHLAQRVQEKIDLGYGHQQFKRIAKGVIGVGTHNATKRGIAFNSV
jgi:hypothetical protein